MDMSVVSSDLKYILFDSSVSFLLGGQGGRLKHSKVSIYLKREVLICEDKVKRCVTCLSNR